MIADSAKILDYLSAQDTPLKAVAQHTERIAALRKQINGSVKRYGKSVVLGGSKADKSQLEAALMEIDSMIEGPLVCGPDVTVADADAFPMLWRLNDANLIPQDCENIAQWLDACSSRPAVKQTVRSSWWWWW